MSVTLIERLSLDGHDSELFSFLEPQLVDELRSHPSASTPLWTFGSIYDLEMDPPIPVLESVSTWNTRPSCLAFTERPDVDPCEPYNGKPSEWHRYRGFTTNEPLIQITALALVRYFFVQGYTCALDDRPWIPKPADPRLERLPFIRNWKPQPDNREVIWSDMKHEFHCWAIDALNQVPQCTAAPDLGPLVDRCIQEASRDAR